MSLNKNNYRVKPPYDYDKAGKFATRVRRKYREKYKPEENGADAPAVGSDLKFDLIRKFWNDYGMVLKSKEVKEKLSNVTIRSNTVLKIDNGVIFFNFDFLDLFNTLSELEEDIPEANDIVRRTKEIIMRLSGNRTQSHSYGRLNGVYGFYNEKNPSTFVMLFFINGSELNENITKSAQNFVMRAGFIDTFVREVASISNSSNISNSLESFYTTFYRKLNGEVVDIASDANSGNIMNSMESEARSIYEDIVSRVGKSSAKIKQAVNELLNNTNPMTPKGVTQDPAKIEYHEFSNMNKIRIYVQAKRMGIKIPTALYTSKQYSHFFDRRIHTQLHAFYLLVPKRVIMPSIEDATKDLEGIKFDMALDSPEAATNQQIKAQKGGVESYEWTEYYAPENTRAITANIGKESGNTFKNRSRFSNVTGELTDKGREAQEYFNKEFNRQAEPDEQPKQNDYEGDEDEVEPNEINESLGLLGKALAEILND